MAVQSWLIIVGGSLVSSAALTTWPSRVSVAPLPPSWLIAGLDRPALAVRR
jgi:hypothetical protein